MIFLAYDLDWYEDSANRGVYLDYKNTVPGPIVTKTDAIVSWIKNDKKLKQQYQLKIQNFYERYCAFGRQGDASKKL